MFVDLIPVFFESRGVIETLHCSYFYKAGKVYIFSGGNTAATNPTNFLEIKLDGSGFFSTGIAGIGSNVSVNALFGFSVAATGDLLPNTLSLTIQSSNVHIFKKRTSAPGPTIISDQVIESPRSTSLLSILNSLHLNVLFGTAIDNAYDVNCDGYADLVVGEPLSSGVTLSQLQTNAVGGAVYVFLGNSGGPYSVTPQYTASVSPGSEFLSVNAVSLFGYSVAGVADTRGPGTAAR